MDHIPSLSCSRDSVHCVTITCGVRVCPRLGSVTFANGHSLHFRKSVDSNVVAQSITRFSSIVEEQLQEKVSFQTLRYLL